MSYSNSIYSVQENVLTTLFYLNQRTFGDIGKVRLVDIKGAITSVLAINSSVGANEVHHDIAALCRKTSKLYEQFRTCTIIEMLSKS